MGYAVCCIYLWYFVSKTKSEFWNKLRIHLSSLFGVAQVGLYPYLNRTLTLNQLMVLHYFRRHSKHDTLFVKTTVSAYSSIFLQPTPIDLDGASWVGDQLVLFSIDRIQYRGLRAFLVPHHDELQGLCLAFRKPRWSKRDFIVSTIILWYAYAVTLLSEANVNFNRSSIRIWTFLEGNAHGGCAFSPLISIHISLVVKYALTFIAQTSVSVCINCTFLTLYL